MVLRPVHVQELGAAARAHPLLARLAYAVRLYLHLAAGAISAYAHVRDMPTLDSDSLWHAPRSRYIDPGRPPAVVEVLPSRARGRKNG
eukprot:scaffold8736_cov39-Phaeocystis_antarctica.AAC.3